jgi:hypothetical protein
MRAIRLFALIASLVLMTSARVSMATPPADAVPPETVTLKLHERKAALGDRLFITYSAFGHENVSYGPYEPFAATVTVHHFLLSDGPSSESISIYRGTRERATETIQWKTFLITLANVSADQKQVVLNVYLKRAK